LSAFGELAYYRAASWLTRDPAGTDGADDFNLYVGANNPWNPFGSRFYHPTGAPNADGTPRVTGAPSDVMVAGSTGVRPREFKAKEVNVLSQSFRGVAGLRGRTFADFEWESGLMYSRAWTRDEESWNIRHSLLQNALLRTDNTAFNPFGYTFRVANNLVQIDQPYTNPDTVMNPLYHTFVREGQTELATWDAKANGTLFSFPGGRVGAAAGVEARWESYSDWRPTFHGQNPPGYVLPAPGSTEGDNDFIGLSPNLNLSSDRNVLSSYAELSFPIVGSKNRRPLVDLLEVTLAGRYEKFSDFGDAFTPKYGLAWRPGRRLLIRASYNESFRAPNLVQTNTQPLQRSVSGVSDPYRFEVTNQIGDGSVSRTVYRQGNASLEPEESRASTIGIAVEVPGVNGLTFTADWWRIDQNGVIDNLTATGQLTRDEQILDAATQEAIAAGQNPNTLDLGSGTAGYKGNPKINRAPVTDADRASYAAYNATRPPGAQRAAVGRVLSVVDDYLNVAGRDIEGIDFALAYRLPKFSFGQFSVRGGATYTTKRDEQLDEFSEVETVLAEDGRAKLRANASLTWRQANWTAAWFTEYYGGSMDIGAATTAAVYEALGKPGYIRVFNDIGGVVRYRWWIEDTYQHSVYLQYRFGRTGDFRNSVSVRFGVTNLFDEEPPAADDSKGYQAGTVGAKGRSYYVEVSKKF
jgi:outer membrane receptor protein involved in Fe transport